jgi:hypothetical protein
MKKLALIFTVFAFVLGVTIISCTKQTTQTDPVITTTADAIVLDNTVSDFTGLLDDYTAANPTFFVDPTLKAASADPLPTTATGVALDKCAKVTIVKTPSMTASAVTGATVKFTIEFTAGCVGNDGKARRGTIVSTFTWVKEGGWSRVSAIDLYVSDVHYVGTQNGTFSKIAPYGHNYFTENSSMTVTAKDGTVKTWTSERQRELMEGNGGVNPNKIWKITGNSTFTNAKGEKSTYSIKEPLYTSTACKGFIAGTVVTVSGGITTTAAYGVYTNAASVTCKDGFTVTKTGANGGPTISTFVKFTK